MTNSKNMDMLLQTHTEFPVLHSLVRKLHILQIFAQLCDCMLAAFRNSAFEQMKRRTHKIKGNRTIGDLRYWLEDSISRRTLNFAAIKGLFGLYTLHNPPEVL